MVMVLKQVRKFKQDTEHVGYKKVQEIENKIS